MSKGSVGATITSRGHLRREADQARQSLRRLLPLIFQARVWMTAALVVMLIGSAMGVVYATHWNRQVFAELRTLQEQRDEFGREWSQLLLEQGAWSAHGRVERVATQDLKMKVAEPEEFRVIR